MFVRNIDERRLERFETAAGHKVRRSDARSGRPAGERGRATGRSERREDASRPREVVRTTRGRRGRDSQQRDHSDSERTDISIRIGSRFPKLTDYDRTAHAYEASFVQATNGYRIGVSACKSLTLPLPPEELEEVLEEVHRERHGPFHPRDDVLPRSPPRSSGGGQARQWFPEDVVAWHWTLERNGEVVDEAERLATEGSQACTATLVAPEPDNYQVNLTLELTGGEETASRSVRIRDRLVVSVGDSYASGQGVPDRAGRPKFANTVRDCPMDIEPIWAEPAAHRSFESGPALAVLGGERRMDGDLVTFLSFAASGATIDEGLLGPQHDWQIEGQLAEAGRTVGERSVDALLLSIGGNDVGFADGLKELTADVLRDRSKTVKRTREAIAGLEAKFDDVAAKVERLSPAEVYITEYPVAHFDEKADGTVGDGCGVFDWAGIAKIDSFEAETIKLLGTLLNQAVKSAAERHGWTYVDGIVDGFRGHGYCRSAEKRYFVTASESCDQQGDFLGTMHPNPAGQRVYAELIADALREGVLAPPPKVRDHRTDSRDRTVRDHRSRRWPRQFDRAGSRPAAGGHSNSSGTRSTPPSSGSRQTFRSRSATASAGSARTDTDPRRGHYKK